MAAMSSGVATKVGLLSLHSRSSRGHGLTGTTGNGLEVTHTESGEHVHTFKTAGSCPIVAWAPTRYCLAYTDLGVLRIVGVDPDRKT